MAGSPTTQLKETTGKHFRVTLRLLQSSQNISYAITTLKSWQLLDPMLDLELSASGKSTYIIICHFWYTIYLRFWLELAFFGIQCILFSAFENAILRSSPIDFISLEFRVHSYFGGAGKNTVATEVWPRKVHGGDKGREVAGGEGTQITALQVIVKIWLLSQRLWACLTCVLCLSLSR